ncbi:hypothetical protein [Marinactinospora rubrisoli]|uniref:Uncharacterized protein n=1 Tax=Marinactinospora rubrisoli TaxID=2715399 RepID=A0ABW2KGB8_9ACTN
MGFALAQGSWTLATLPFQPPWNFWDAAGLAGIAWAITTLVARAGGHGCGASLGAGALMALAVVAALAATPAGW